ncbi:MAG: hypothetical protein K2Y23_19830 [Cyanobacteria bacterium]|nr:hypothetical protein [Cyanobacteriota bacterium]
MATLDPELVRQMAISGDAPVEAVVRLRDADGSPRPPEETQRLAQALVERSKLLSGERQSSINVFRYLGSFAIVARPALIKVLIAQPEVVAAVANRQPGSALMPPIDKRSARIVDVGRRGPRAAKSATSKRRTPPRKKK